VGNVHNEILLGDTKEWTDKYNMDTSQKHYTEWKKKGTKWVYTVRGGKADL
jgi:hypothetical protein